MRILGAQSLLVDLVEVLHQRLVPLRLVERLWLQRVEEAKAFVVACLRFLSVASALVVDAAKVCRDNRVDLRVHLTNKFSCFFVVVKVRLVDVVRVLCGLIQILEKSVRLVAFDLVTPSEA